MQHQASRGYGRNRNNSGRFTGKDPNPDRPRINDNFEGTFRDPDNRKRSNSGWNDSRVVTYNPNHGSKTRSDKPEHRVSSTDRNVPASYKDAIKIRYLEDENEKFRNDLKDWEDDRELIKNLGREIDDLKMKLKLLNRDNDRLETEKKMNPCIFKNGKWKINLGGKWFVCDENDGETSE